MLRSQIKMSSRRKRETVSGMSRYVLSNCSSARVMRAAARRMARPHVAQYTACGWIPRRLDDARLGMSRLHEEQLGEGKPRGRGVCFGNDRGGG